MSINKATLLQYFDLDQQLGATRSLKLISSSHPIAIGQSEQTTAV
jgi:hypothetical protein